MNNKEYILKLKKENLILSRKYFFNHFPEILKEIDEHNEKYNLDNKLFSQEVYNWIYDIKINPKCPVSGKNVLFDAHNFKYKTYRGKGLRTKEARKKSLEKKMENFDGKKIYDDKRKIRAKRISFHNFRELLYENFYPITNYGSFCVSLLSRYPEIYNFVKSDKFLPECCSLQEKIYRVIHNMKDYPKCQYDEKSKCNFLGFTKGYSKYNNKNYKKARKSEREKIISEIKPKNVYDKELTVKKINEYIKDIEMKNLSKQNLYQSFYSRDPVLIKSIIEHTKEYEDIKFSNRVFLLLNGEPNPDKKYIKPVFNSLSRGYDMRFENAGVSKSEREIFDWLGQYIDDIKKTRILDGKEIDIYSPSRKIGIEYDGIYWHNSEIVGNSACFLKQKLANEKNIRLLTIFETEWIHKEDICKSMILSKFGIFERKIYARTCELKKIDKDVSSSFLKNNHLQGTDNSKYKFGLYYKGELVSVMTFGKRKISGTNEMELMRFCNKKFTTVIGGASKLFKFFIRNYEFNKIKSYANVRISDGDLYKKLGFNFKHWSRPTYWYFYPQNPKYKELKHRSGFQKHKLKYILENFDPEKSEWENMRNHGYLKIYDAGNLVFEYSK